MGVWLPAANNELIEYVKVNNHFTPALYHSFSGGYDFQVFSIMI